MNALEVRDLSLTYGSVPVLQGVSFDLPAGAHLAIIGENGSGKTTLFRGLIGLLPPLSGTVRIGDDSGRIGYLPQADGIPAHFPASVREVVYSGALNRRRPWIGRQDKAAALAFLTRLDMAPFVDRPFQTLSGGQRQRVLLARALLASDRLIFLDEPTSGLDAGAEADLYALLAELNEQAQLTLVTISHDLEAVVSVASHVLVLHHGRQVFFGPVADFLRAAGEIEEGGLPWHSLGS